jgi:hypothetical protein
MKRVELGDSDDPQFRGAATGRNDGFALQETDSDEQRFLIRKSTSALSQRASSFPSQSVYNAVCLADRYDHGRATAGNLELDEESQETESYTLLGDPASAFASSLSTQHPNSIQYLCTATHRDRFTWQEICN